MEEGSRFFEEKGAVHDTLRDITGHLDRSGIPYAVCGGMALFAHGYRRFADHLSVLLTKEGHRKLYSELRGRGYLPPFEGSRNLRNTETKVKVEFLITGNFPGDGKPKPVAFPAPDADTIEVQGIKYLGLRTLVELKLASGLSSPDRAKDLFDVSELIRTLSLPRQLATELDASVANEYLSLWDRLHAVKRRFIRPWRNKWLTADARTLDDMIKMLRGASEELTAMKADGIQLEFPSGIAEDYAELVTEDPAIAAKWGFHDEREFLDDDYFDEFEDESDGESAEKSP